MIHCLDQFHERNLYFISSSITGFSIYADDRTLNRENHVSAQEMSHTITLSLIGVEILEFDHFHSVVKNVFSKTSL